MAKQILVSIFLLISFCSFGQYTICDCCTYASLKYEENYENIFNQEIIKKNNIKELTIFTTSKQSSINKDSTFKIVDKEYKEMILRFDVNGFVESQILFNRLGQYHSINEFTRDSNGKILTKTFHYLDSLGKKDEEFLVDKWIYKYSNGLLQQIKKLGDKQIIQPDNKSSFESFEYDTKARLIKAVRQTYYDDNQPIFFYQTVIKYNDTTSSSTAITKDKKKLFSTVKNKYDANQKPLNSKFFDGRNNKLIEEKVFTYNSSGQLTKFEVKNSGMGTECPDGGNFSDTYFYSPLNLISNIRHQYKGTICELRFAYR